MFDTAADFLAMDGHGPYIWGSYGVCIGLTMILAVQSVLRWKRRQRELDVLRESRSRQTR